MKYNKATIVYDGLIFLKSKGCSDPKRSTDYYFVIKMFSRLKDSIPHNGITITGDDLDDNISRIYFNYIDAKNRNSMICLVLYKE
jgi:hypothetical protein